MNANGNSSLRWRPSVPMSQGPYQKFKTNLLNNQASHRIISLPSLLSNSPRELGTSRLFTKLLKKGWIHVHTKYNANKIKFHTQNLNLQRNVQRNQTVKQGLCSQQQVGKHTQKKQKNKLQQQIIRFFQLIEIKEVFYKPKVFNIRDFLVINLHTGISFSHWNLYT